MIRKLSLVAAGAVMGALSVATLQYTDTAAVAANSDTYKQLSIFGEVSPFHTSAELNYLALANFGSDDNPKADLDVFLREVAGPMLGGEEAAREYFRCARLLDDRKNIPSALEQINSRAAASPAEVARRWTWLANYLASFVYRES